jgi:hypothetical protein
MDGGWLRWVLQLAEEEGWVRYGSIGPRNHTGVEHTEKEEADTLQCSRPDKRQQMRVRGDLGEVSWGKSVAHGKDFDEAPPTFK